MKGFVRKNQLFSLCGLNCGLCPMFIGKYCGGCGGGNQPCAIARCAVERGGVEYCFECPRYPCEKYDHAGETDSFITHLHQKADLERAKAIGIGAYSAEQTEKAGMLSALLSACNDGRRKSLYCAAVNLLEISDLREAMRRIGERADPPDAPVSEKAAFAAKVLQETADRNGVSLKEKKPALPKEGGL